MCAKVYKNSVADSLTKKHVLSAFFCHDDIIYYRAKRKPHRAHEKRKKAVFPLYACIIDNKPP